MTLSKRAIRPAQTLFLLANNILPISLDYRLCPEINMIDGPITDVRDAYAWAQKNLPQVVRHKDIIVDTSKIVVIGWSSGGHLAMSTAWTTKEVGLQPPKAILSFYGPTDFESGGTLIGSYRHRFDADEVRSRRTTCRDVSREKDVNDSDTEVSAHSAGMQIETKAQMTFFQILSVKNRSQATTATP